MISADNAQLPPDLQVRQWFNTDKPITLSELRGKVVAIEAFQMLCPGCINHGI
ncbi:MAG: TlpA family protein disulfide reductase, partial [Dinoroseobacter sp.]|nr:TlpA family protein disulfide reductase [Dinoroseobacter sp.]